MNEFEASAVLWTNLLMGAGVAALILTSLATSVVSLWRTRREARSVRQTVTVH